MLSLVQNHGWLLKSPVVKSFLLATLHTGQTDKPKNAVAAFSLWFEIAWSAQNRLNFEPTVKWYGSSWRLQVCIPCIYVHTTSHLRKIRTVWWNCAGLLKWLKGKRLRPKATSGSSETSTYQTLLGQTDPHHSNLTVHWQKLMTYFWTYSMTLDLLKWLPHRQDKTISLTCFWQQTRHWLMRLTAGLA